MSDNKLNLMIKITSALLAVSVIFCTFAVIYTKNTNRAVTEEQEQSQVAQTEEAAEPSPALPEEEAAEPVIADASVPVEAERKKIVVIDAGHGKSSGNMTKEEKESEGFVYNDERGSWGEWRHYKNDTFGEDCHGSGCTQTAPSNGSCWYPMGNGDRDAEPEINLNNALAAQRYLEAMGYEVRMTRVSNEQNPSMNKRVSYCFPDNDTSLEPDASLYVCIHSNAGGGRGTSYIALEDTYRQGFIPDDYISRSNTAGDIINKRIAAATGLSEGRPIGNEGYLILFNKSPVPIAYLEIGFFDNSSDLEILQNSSDAIGQAIAQGVDEFLQ